MRSFKAHLAADRTSCHTASANQMRLFLHAGAYWMMWSLRCADAATASMQVAGLCYRSPCRIFHEP
jgi:hypothetical protein